MSISRQTSFWRIIFLLITLITISSCQSNSDTWERIQHTQTLRVGLDPTYPPFENADSGTLEGLDVDLAEEIGRELNLTIEFVYFGYDGLYDALATQQVDVLLSALVSDISKTKDFAFSDPYFNAGQYLVAHQETAAAQTITEMADLANQTVAVEIGSEGHVQAIAWERRVPNLTIITLPTADDALWLVLQQEADVALVDQVSGRLYIQQFPTLTLIPEPVTVEPYVLVTRIADETLLQKLDGALEALEEDGRLETIQAAWLDS